MAGLLLGGFALAQEGPLQNTQPKGITPEQIIQKFAEKEADFKLARDNDTFRLFNNTTGGGVTNASLRDRLRYGWNF